MEGTVKWFNRKKGFGFIKGDDDDDYFVHYTAVPQGTVLNENDRVSFDPVDGDRGKQAQNVSLLDGQAAPAEEPAEEEAPAEEPAEEEAPAEEPAEEETPAEEPAEEETPAEEPAEEEKTE